MTLTVVGGTYREECKEGEWRQLYGSGLRAAASLQQAGPISLHTYVGPKDQPLAEAMAVTFQLQLNAIGSAESIAFAYDHGLSVPLVFPPLQIVAPQTPISVTADKVLRFGMVEGDAIVDGDMVVYDPQSAYSPNLFHLNGSQAKRLIIICNQRELMLLTGEADLAAGASKLRSLDGAEAVVVKCGSHGAFLFSDNGQQIIPAFQTSRVWPIGSGDVFAAAFFACWSRYGQSPDLAATTASRAAACYCDTRALPLPELTAGLPKYSALSLRTIVPGEKKPSIYLAGPFFDMGQRWLVYEARAALIDQGLDVFSPYHDVGVGVTTEVVPADVEGLKQADVVLALLDHLDSGTLFEVGYARSLEKPVIGFCQNVPEDALKMLVGTDCDIVDDFVTAIYRTAWAALRS